MQKGLVFLAIACGLFIAYVDSRPTWDDTGITVGAILIACIVFGAIEPRRPWLWALAVGIWIPILAIASTRNYGSLLALLFAFVGAYLGMAIRKGISRVPLI